MSNAAICPSDHSTSRTILPARILREGILAARAGRRIKARFLVRLANQLDPTSILAWQWMAELVEAEDEKLSCLFRIAELNPQKESTKKSLARAIVRCSVKLYQLKRREEARTAFHRAAEVDPTNVSALLGVAVTTLDPVEAVSWYGKVLAIDPTNAVARKRMATHIHATATPHHCPICQATTEPAQRVCPGCHSILTLDNPLAFDGATGCDTVTVSANLERLQRESVANPAALLTLGIAYLNLGRTSQAVKVLKRAVVGFPADAAIREQVFRLVERHVAAKSTIRMRRPVLPESRMAPLVIVADEHPTSRAVISATLSSAGYRTACVCDGTEIDAAIQLEGPPALVILDGNMPNMNGFATCKMLHRRADTRKTPVILLTNHDSLLSKMRGQFAGVTEHVVKPIQPLALLAVVRKHVALPTTTTCAGGNALPGGE
jgi:CheY-like chemotaxis protein